MVKPYCKAPNHPLVPPIVYHGSEQRFASFSLDKLGKNTDSPSARMGIFFAATKEVAESYVNHEVISAKAASQEMEKNEKRLRELTGKSYIANTFDQFHGRWDTHPHREELTNLMERHVELEDMASMNDMPYSPSRADHAWVYEVALTLQNPLVHGFKSTCGNSPPL